MRKSGLITALILFTVIILLYVTFSDRFVERQLESVLSGMINSAVELDGFHYSILSLRAGWDRLQVTDPNDGWTNIVETGKAGFDIDPLPLLYGRSVIEELRLEDVRSGTARETDGTIHEDAVAEEPGILDIASENIQKDIERNSGVDFSVLDKKVDAAAVVTMLDMQTPAHIESLRAGVEATAARWEEILKSAPELQARSEELVNRARLIKPENLREITDFMQAANTLNSIRKDAGSLKEEIVQRVESVRTDYGALNAAVRSVDDLINADIDRARSLAKLPDLNTENIARILFGQELVDKLNKGLEYLGVARGYAEEYADNTKVESPPRQLGQDIHFEETVKWPKFWIKNIVLSGNTGTDESGIALSGTAMNISSNQKITGMPLELNLEGSKGIREYKITGIMDHSGDIALETFSLNINGISLNNTPLKGVSLLPDAVEKGIMNVRSAITLSGDSLDGSIGFAARETVFRFTDETGGRIKALSRRVFDSAETIQLDARISGRAANPRFSLSSNLDELFAVQLKQIAGAEIERGKTAIRTEVLRRIEPEKQRFLAYYNDTLKEYETKTGGLELLSGTNDTAVNELADRLIERIDSERNPLLKQALKQVKNLINRK